FSLGGAKRDRMLSAAIGDGGGRGALVLGPEFSRQPDGASRTSQPEASIASGSSAVASPTYSSACSAGSRLRIAKAYTARPRSATVRTSHPNVSSLRGPWRPSSGIELGVLMSKELRYEIAPMPSRYGQSQTALRQSSDTLRSLV